MEEVFTITVKNILLLILSLISATIICYSSYLYINVKNTIEVIHSPIIIEETSKSISNTSENPVSKKKSTSPPPITFLLLGIDQFENSPGRSDTILILTLNPQTNTTTMLSIPRDTYTKIIGMNISDKINHSYSFGGIEMAYATVENLLQISIDYVVTINMNGFIELVDLLEGIEVQNEFAFSSNGFDYPKGEITLTGEQALNYVRMRKEDPLGDFGRQMRQQIVIERLLDETSSLNLVWQVPSLLEAIRNNVETNLTFDEIKHIARNYKPALQNTEQLSFQEGEGRMKNGIWYYFASEEELGEIRDLLTQSSLLK